MHRTEGSNNNGGLFTDSPPGTTVEQKWLNSVQEEIAYVIESSGKALYMADNDTRTQLYESIETIIGVQIATLSRYQITGNYVVPNFFAFNIIEADSTLGNITVTLPDLASNYGRAYYIVHNIQGGTNTLTVQRGGADVITADSLSSIELPEAQNYLYVYASEQAGCWVILSESITCELRLDGYAGYGSVDTAIMRFTNSRKNVGNLFTENHSTGYNGNTEGLEFTIVKSGVYSFSYSLAYATAGTIRFGFSLDSAQLATTIIGINAQDRLAVSTSSGATAVNLFASCSWKGFLTSGAVVRAHANSTAPGDALIDHITGSYGG